LNFEVRDIYRLPLIVGMSGLPDGWLVRSVRFDGRDVTDQAVDFGAPAANRRLEIHVTNRVARPRVRVIDDDGHPVTTYQVVVIPADPAHSGGTRFAQLDTPSDEGVVPLEPTLPGEYLIAALPWEEVAVLFQERARLETLRLTARRITLAEGDDRLLELRLTRLPPARQ
jgi:hypothetical protein